MEKEEIKFNKKDWRVETIPADQTYEWLLNKHYAKRVPQIMFSFGLYDKGKNLQGVCTFGMPTRVMNNGEAIFGGELKIKTVELNRLVVNENLGKNVLSFFVSKCLLFLPKPICVVSYADNNQGHHGYIYQATNWIFTGLNQVHERKIKDKNGKDLHPRTAWEMAKKAGFDNTMDFIKSSKEYEQGEYTKKYRYFQFLGNKKEVLEMKKKLKYKIYPYPKGENKRYDASYKPLTTNSLF